MPGCAAVAAPQQARTGTSLVQRCCLQGLAAGVLPIALFEEETGEEQAGKSRKRSRKGDSGRVIGSLIVVTSPAWIIPLLHHLG